MTTESSDLGEVEPIFAAVEVAWRDPFSAPDICSVCAHEPDDI